MMKRYDSTTSLASPGRSVISPGIARDRKSTRLNSSHSQISYAVFCLKKKKHTYKTSFTSFRHHTRNKTRDDLIMCRNIRTFSSRVNTSSTHAYSIVLASTHITFDRS